MSRLGKIGAISPRSWPEEPSFAQHAMISAPWPFLGLPQHETTRNGGAARLRCPLTLCSGVSTSSEAMLQHVLQIAPGAAL